MNNCNTLGIFVLLTLPCGAMLCPSTAAFRQSGSNVYVLNVDTSKYIHETSDKFLSLTIDSSLIYYRWEGLDFRSKKLQTLAKGLAPAYWRIGGTAADACVFNGSGSVPQNENPKNSKVGFAYPTFYFSESDWDDMNKLAMTSGWKLLFDLNSLLRHKDGSWDSSNAMQILTYSIKKGYNWNLDFEIGNEPDQYPGGLKVNGTQLGKDSLLLYQLLKDHPEFKKYYSSSIVVGPDTGGLSTKMITDYLKTIGNKLHAATFHHYYGSGKKANLSHFTDVATLDSLRGFLKQALGLVAESASPGVKVWLGETSSGYGGGTPNVADRFAAGFMWLDKLGMSASLGLDVVVRQALFGYKYHDGPKYTMDYTLLDRYMNPNPDYWTSYIYKSLISPRVLNITVKKLGSVQDNAVRMYAHCTKHISQVFTVYGMNVGNYTATLQFPSTFTGVKADVYLLTAYGPDGLTSKFMALNGEELKLVDDVTLPTLKPVSYVINKQTITLPAKSLVFMVVNKPIPGCM